MHIGAFYSMDAAYHRLYEEVKKRGIKMRPRGLESIEMRPASFTISSPDVGLYTGRSRNLNHRFLAIEALSYIAGWGADKDHAKLLCASNSKMKEFVNQDTGTFDGAYGPRLSRPLAEAVSLLAEDPDSRQAVASIWSPGIPKGSLDVPCTLSLHLFKNWQGALAMSVAMRSNDLNWGTPYDVAAFSAIQMAVARCLRWETGGYFHNTGSLHYYPATPPTIESPDKETFRRISGWPPYSARPKVGDPVAEWADLKSKAEEVLDQALKLRVVGGNPWSKMPGGFGDRDQDMWAEMIRGDEAT